MSTEVEIQEPEGLALVVSTFSPGVLATNARNILAFVKGKLPSYKLENYAGGKIAEAKRDKAELNNASKTLDEERLKLEREYMKPFMDFKDVVNETRAEIAKVSAAIDGVVKDAEKVEKDEKRKDIEGIFAKVGCTLFTLDQVFVSAWLNKGTKLKDIEAEITARGEKVTADLLVLEELKEPDAKAHYLTTLDLGAALRETASLKANRIRLQPEADAKAAREAEPAPVVPSPAAAPDPVAPVPAAEPERATMIFYSLRLWGSREKLVALCAYMDANGIGHEKL